MAAETNTGTTPTPQGSALHPEAHQKASLPVLQGKAGELMVVKNKGEA